MRLASVLIPLIGLMLATGLDVQAQGGLPEYGPDADKYRIDLNDMEITDVINMMSRITKKNFIYDERVRGRVTVLSPTPVTADEAYHVFEAILQVKGFTTVEGPGGILKIVPLRDAKQSPIETVPGERSVANRDRFITRLLPLLYVKADAIINTLRPLISKDANLIAYAPTNTMILTDTEANIRRLVSIISEIDIETHQEQIKIIPIEYADASGLVGQLNEIFADPSTGSRGTGATGRAATRRTGAAARRRAAQAAAATTAATSGTGVIGQVGQPRFIPDERTNSIIVMAPAATIDEVERLVSLLDYRREGTGRIHVYRLQNADAEEMAQTLASLVTGGARRTAAPVPGGSAAQQAATAVAELGEGIRITADAPTNSLIIQASSEGFGTLQDVIQALDIRRPQVMVEALIMEVNVDDSNALGAAFLAQTLLDSSDKRTRILAGSAQGASSLDPDGSSIGQAAINDFAAAILGKSFTIINPDGTTSVVPVIQGILTARASDQDTNIISAPVILTADNEEAQIVVGQNIPVPTSRLQTPDSATTGAFTTSSNIERQDVGVTLRVTPQISEGDTIRLNIFQEISEVIPAEASDLGPTTTQRTVENTVYVRDGEAVMIGGILSENETESTAKVPWIGDIPILGWAFKSKSTTIRKVNLIVVLTPHIVRDPEDLNQLTVEHRERFRDAASEALEYDEEQAEARQRAIAAGVDLPHDTNPVRRAIERHERDYPVQDLPRMRRRGNEREILRVKEIERLKAEEAAGSYLVQVAFFRKPGEAVDLLNSLISSGYDGTIFSRLERQETVHVVQLGPYPDQDRAQHIAREVRASTGLNTYVVVQP